MSIELEFKAPLKGMARIGSVLHTSQGFLKINCRKKNSEEDLHWLQRIKLRCFCGSASKDFILLVTTLTTSNQVKASEIE